MSNANLSFELLWEASEQLFVQDASDVQSITNELIAKISLYKALDANPDIDHDAKVKLKERTMGTILTTLTNLSRKDDINVYVSLKDAIAVAKMDQMAAKISK